LPLELADHRPVAALADVEHGVLRHLVHEPHAACAQNAARRHVQYVAAEVFGWIEPLGVLQPSDSPSLAVRVILQLAFTRLVTDRTVERMVDEQELEHGLARPERAVR